MTDNPNANATTGEQLRLPPPRWLPHSLLRIPHGIQALFDQGLISGANVLLVLIAARLLSPADFAVFGLGYLIVVTASNLHQGFLLTPLGLLLPEYPIAQARSILVRVAIWHWPLLPGALAGLVMAWILPGIWSVIAAIFALICARLALEHERRCAYAVHDGARAMVMAIAGYGSQGLAGVALFVLADGCPIALPFMIMTCCALFGVIIGKCLLAGLRLGPGAPWRSCWAAHWVSGRWLSASAAVQAVAENLYPFLVFGLLGPLETAVLVGARQLVGVGNVVLNGLETAAIPRLRSAVVAEQHQPGPPRLLPHLAPWGLTIAVLVLPPCVVVMIWPDAIMALALGPEYQAHGWVLACMAGLFLLRAVNRMFALALLALKITGSGLIAATLGAVISLSAGPWLIAHWSLLGVIAAYFTNQVLTMAVLAIGLAWGRRRLTTGPMAERG